jgi:hypothetical protein
MGLTVAAFVAAVVGAAIVVLSMGLMRVHPMLAVGLNLVAVGGLTPTVWTGVSDWSGAGLCSALPSAWPAHGLPCWPSRLRSNRNSPNKLLGQSRSPRRKVLGSENAQDDLIGARFA